MGANIRGGGGWRINETLRYFVIIYCYIIEDILFKRGNFEKK